MTQQVFRAEGAKATVWLDGPDWEGAPAATVGGFACKSVAGGADVLAQALAYLRQQGARAVIGPMDGDTWHSYRFVTQSDGSPAFLLEPGHVPLGNEVFEAAGFAQIGQYFSARVRLADWAKAPPARSGDFRIVPWDGTDAEALFAQVHALSVEAFAANAFYKPISREAFLAMYMPMVPMLKRELIFFARRPDDSLAGFLFGTPNYAEGPAPKSAILKTYASLARGAGGHLLHAFHVAAAAMGHDTVIHALMHDDNQSAQRSAAEGADVFRRYGLYGLRL